MRINSRILWSLGFLMALITGAGAKTIHVATTGDDTSGDGSSGNPYQTIQKGIDEAAIFGDKVDVAAGTYRESLFWDVKSLILQGAGTGSTIVDGDLDGDGSRDARCLYTRNVDDKARVTGITFQNGYAGDYAHGGGIYLESSDLTLMDSEIKDSNAYYRGGGLYLQGGAPILNDNLIQNNVASWQTGGGLYVDQSAASLTSNEITTNTAHDQGGGLYLYQSAASLTDNEITDNTAGNRGGGVYILQSSASLTGNSISGNHVTNENGGGVYLRSASATLTGNEITSNQADSGAGGGVFMETSGDTLDGNLISGNIAITVAGGCYLWDTDNATLVNNLIVANYAADSGAGIFLHLSDSPLTNNTVADNWGEGILGSSDPGSPIITNGVFWGNDDDLVGVTATYSDIGTGETAGTGNISADPLFKGGSDPWYAYDLQDVSPCLNVGDNTVDPLPEKDVHGDPRVLEGTVDMGADEQLHFSAVRQPDLWIKQGSNWLGDDLYHEDGTDQRGTRNVVTGATAVYQARLYNDGTKAATIWIKGPAGSDNCVVRYYRGTTVNPDRDVTDLVTSSKGWKRAQVPIGGKQAFLIAVTPGPGLRKNFEFGVVASSNVELAAGLVDQKRQNLVGE